MPRCRERDEKLRVAFVRSRLRPGPADSVRGPGTHTSEVVGGMFNLTESVVREYLRDHSGTIYCADCLSAALAESPPRSVISTIMAELAERQPPFAAGRCGCGREGLTYSAP